MSGLCRALSATRMAMAIRTAAASQRSDPATGRIPFASAAPPSTAAVA
jgi:hypothetical protein